MLSAGRGKSELGPLCSFRSREPFNTRKQLAFVAAQTDKLSTLWGLPPHLRCVSALEVLPGGELKKKRTNKNLNPSKREQKKREEWDAWRGTGRDGPVQSKLVSRRPVVGKEVREREPGFVRARGCLFGYEPRRKEVRVNHLLLQTGLSGGGNWALKRASGWGRWSSPRGGELCPGAAARRAGSGQGGRMQET